MSGSAAGRLKQAMGQHEHLGPEFTEPAQGSLFHGPRVVSGNYVKTSEKPHAVGTIKVGGCVMPQRKPKASELQYFGQAGSPLEPSHQHCCRGARGAHRRPPRHTESDGCGAQVAGGLGGPLHSRSRGIGSMTPPLERSRLGLMAGDNVVTAKGNRFQQSVGVTPAPMQEEYSKRWVSNTVVHPLFGRHGEYEAGVRVTIQGAQGHMLQQQQFDPSLVRAAASIGQRTLLVAAGKPAEQGANLRSQGVPAWWPRSVQWWHAS